MRPHRRPSIRVVAIRPRTSPRSPSSPTAPAHPASRAGVTLGVTVVEVEQHRHRLHRRPVRLEIRADIHQPRQPRRAIPARLTRQMHTGRRPRPPEPPARTCACQRSMLGPPPQLMAPDPGRVGRPQRAHGPVARTAPPIQAAHMLVNTSIMSRTRSSVVSPESATTIRRPCADNAASSCSTPKRANRPDAPQRPPWHRGPTKSGAARAASPFSPDPTSHTTCPTAGPDPSPTRSPGPLAYPNPSADHARHPHIHHHTHAAISRRGGPDQNQPPTRSAGTGNVPSRNQR